jgi:preprotein translocase subunit SecY
LDVQSSDLKEVRAQEKRESWQVSIIILAVFLIVAAVLTYAIRSDKDQFVLELTRIILTAFGGGGVGYVAGNRSRKKEISADEN